MSFKLLIGEPVRDVLITSPPGGSVGTISMTDGSLAHVIMESRATDPGFEAGLERRRRAIARDPELGRDGYWAWRHGDNDGVPTMLDTSDLAT